MRWIVIIAMVLFCCNDDSDNNTDGDADGDSDTDGDTDTDGDSDEPTEGELLRANGGPEDCPLNSGWPCTCTGLDPCDDGSPCIGVPPYTDRQWGICTADCVPDVVPREQCPATDYTGMGLCRIQESEWGDPTHCLLGCGHTPNCPSDQECVQTEMSEEFGFCFPIP